MGCCLPCVKPQHRAIEKVQTVYYDALERRTGPSGKFYDANSTRAVVMAVARQQSFAGSKRSLSGTPTSLTSSKEVGVSEEIARINDRYVESLRELSPMSNVLAAETLGDGSNYSAGLQGEVFQVTMCKTFEGDPVKACAILCEMDLCQKWMPNVQVVQALETSMQPRDSVWYLKQLNDVGGQEDMILYCSFVDALNEPMKALWFCQYTPPGDEDEVRGVKFPPLDPEARRLDAHSSYCIEPTGSNQFKLTLCACVVLPSVALKALAWIPSFALKRQARGLMQQKLDPFCQCLGSEEIDARMQSGDRAEFYKQVRAHVQDSAFVPSYAKSGLKCGM